MAGSLSRHATKGGVLTEVIPSAVDEVGGSSPQPPRKPCRICSSSGEMPRGSSGCGRSPKAFPVPTSSSTMCVTGDSSVVVSAIPEIRRCADRAPVLVDDIISFAATMSETVRQWREAGLAAPVCLGVHGVFAAH